MGQTESHSFNPVKARDFRASIVAETETSVSEVKVYLNESELHEYNCDADNKYSSGRISENRNYSILRLENS